MEGFFNLSEFQGRRQELLLIPQCGACGLFRKCKSPKMKPSGKGRKGILIVGEAPGEVEDARGQPFVGKSGIFLKETLLRSGIEPMRDCWFTNAIICHGTPSDKTVEHCRPNLLSTIQDLEPRIIILLGGTALDSLVGHIWKEDLGGIMKWAGWKIPCADPNAWVCPTFHPAFVLRMEKHPTVRLFFEKHLQEAIRLKDRPWGAVPDYESEVEVVLSPQEALQTIEGVVKTASGGVSFDFETDHLKPDRGSASIVCCSLSNGEKTVAYPWTSTTARATKEFLVSSTPKIGQNVKFEHRWALAKLGVSVRNWQWDTMIAAHTLDNRQGVCGLKFQSFVKLGAPPYDKVVKPFLESVTPAGPNRVRDVDMESLCLYCAMDSLLTHKLARLQMKEFGYGGK